jgi:hypothetical protein
MGGATAPDPRHRISGTVWLLDAWNMLEIRTARIEDVEGIVQSIPGAWGALKNL